ncbi:quinon protein alcohol dehydrogenase-like superfamily [Chytridium lagenaria]|nr:quinon protein alcohol dehydrogenase-like superfamily [Chytridium lagenaria]
MEQVMTIVDKLPVGLDEMGRPNTEIMRILGAVVCLREPVTESALSELIGMELVLLTSILRTAQAILNVSVRDAKVRTWGDLHQHPSSWPSSWIGAISDALSYACRYWAVHISGCLGTAPSLLRLIDRMSSERLPEWLEALSYLKSVDKIAVASLRSLVSWYPHTSIASPVILAKQEASRSVNGPRATRVLMTDLLRMVLEFRAPIVESPEDVYRSALPFCPSLSALCQAYSHRYKDARWGPCLFSLGGQGRDDSAPVLSVSISSDGSRFLSGSADGSLRLWSLETGEALKVFEWDAGEISVTKTRVEAAAIGYGDGNSTIGLTTSEEGNLFEEDWRESDPSLPFIAGNRFGKATGWACMTAIVFSKETRVVVIAGDEKIASISLDTGKTLWMRKESRCQIILVKAVQQNTKLIVGAGSAIRILAADTGSPLSSMEIAHHLITALAATKDGTIIAYGSDDALIRLINSDDGTTLCTLAGHHGPITSIDISPDGRKVVSASSDGTVRIWLSIPSPKTSDYQSHRNGSCRYLNIESSSDPSSPTSPVTIELSSRLEGADLYDTASSSSEVGHTQGVTCVSITPDGHRVVSGSIDGTIKICEESHTDIVLCVAISKSYLKPDTSSDDSLDSNHSYKDGSGTIYHRGSVDLKRISTTSRPDLFPEKVTSSPTTAPKVSSPLARDSTVASKPIITSLPELDVSELVASGSRDRTVKLWSTSTGDLLHTFKGHMAPVYSVAIRTDRKMVASGSSDGVIKLWSVASGNLIRDFHHGGDHGGRVKDLEFTADGTRLLSWIENKVLVWHLHNGILENRIDGPVRLCADHRHICVQDSTSGLEKILDTATFMEVAAKDQPKPAPSRDVKIVNGWVVDADAKRVMWLPEEFRGMAMTDYSGKFLVLFGYKGRECFIRL